MSQEFTGIGNNCGNCIRGSKSVSEPKCVECARIEKEENKKFTQWEKKK